MARTGYGTIPTGESVHVVSDGSVASDSHVVVTLSADPSTKAGGAAVSHVVKETGVGFTIYMANPVYSNVEFDYSIL